MAAKGALLDKLTLCAPHLSSKQMIPAFVYGTAWKKEATASLVFQALSNGFTAIDTACQPKHYREDLVGDGLRKAIAQLSLRRSEVYIQTKFTSIAGQDPNNIPYDSKASLTEQVKQSIERSLHHFDVAEAEKSRAHQEAEDPYLDTVVLHSPMSNIDDTMEVWRTLETYVPHKIHNIGISNCDLFTLMNVYERATIKPAVVQNRFYPQTKFDIGLRKFCHEKNIIYQSFWTLTANPDLLRTSSVNEVASRLNISQPAALYCLVLGLGNTVILNGTTNVEHMKQDWSAFAAAKSFAESNKTDWQTQIARFRRDIGEVPRS